MHGATFVVIIVESYTTNVSLCGGRFVLVHIFGVIRFRVVHDKDTSFQSCN